jgi:hypothetical protein
MLHEDLIQNYNAVCEKANLAIQKANDEIAHRGCLEIEIAGLKQELKKAYNEISKLKYQNSLDTSK